MKQIIALVLVVCVLIAGALYVQQEDAAEQRYMRQMYAEVEPLQQQIDELERQKKSLQQEYERKKRDPSSVQLLVRDLSADIFDLVYPIMRTHGVTGVLGVSLASRPSRYGNQVMTVEQYNRLILDGWGTCLIYDGRSFEDYYNNMQRYMSSLSLSMPTAIYFPSGYDAALQQTLIDYGITTVIVNAPDGHSNTVTEFDPIWVTGAMPWNYTGVIDDLERLAVTEGGNLTFTLSTNDILDIFEDQAFVDMMNVWYALSAGKENVKTGTAAAKNSEVDPLLVVASYEQARTTHETANMNGILLDRELNAKLDELDQQISSINGQIQDIYEAIDESRSNSLLSRIVG